MAQASAMAILIWDEQISEIKKEFPRFRIRSYLDNPFFGLLWKLGWRMGATTIWNTVYMDPVDIGKPSGTEILVHEIVHVRDQHRWGPLFFLTYFILPVGPSLKAFWEWRAYKESLRRWWEEWHLSKNYETYADRFCADLAEDFCNSDYAWMWPFRSFMKKKSLDFLRSLSTPR